MTTADHSVLELRPILCHDILDPRLLEKRRRLKVFDENFVCTEVSDSLVKLVVLATHFNDVVDQLTILAKLALQSFCKVLLRDIGQDEEILAQVLFLEELVTDAGGFLRVDDKHLETLLHGDFHSDVVSAVDRFDQFVELAEVTTTAGFKLFQSLIEPCVLTLDVLLTLELSQFELLFEQLLLGFTEFLSFVKLETF